MKHQELFPPPKWLMALAAGAMVSGHSATAADFLIGTRGPKNWQLDERFTYSEKHTTGGRLDIAAHTSVLKYWSGERLGMFGIGSLPYKWMSKGDLQSQGFGDLELKGGPRGYFDFENGGSFHWTSFAGLSLPTGDEMARPALGSGGLDIKVGAITTYLSAHKKNEITTLFEYTIPEEKTKKTVADELSASFLIGRQITSKIRLGVGMTGILKQGGDADGDYTLNARLMARYALSKNWHVQALGETSVAHRDLPRGFTAGVFLRYNF